MLDLTRLARQMQGISQHLTQEAVISRQRLEQTQQLIGQAQARQAELLQLQQTWRDRLGFAAAVPLEPLETRKAIAPAPALHTVMATDGSQIAPNHHEIAYCYLINVGRVVLHYGQGRYPFLDSVPEVFYRADDLYVSRQWGIRTEEWMGYRRTISEAVMLADLGEQWVTEQQSIGMNPGDASSPAVAMVDGSLIHWFLEPLPLEARDRILPPILDAWDRLRSAGVPLVGYISASRSSEAINFLRFQTCPYDAPDCLSHCAGHSDQAPCHVFNPLRDTALWSVLLEPGQRGPIWRSSAKILEQYGDHSICFCHVHVGSEIARIEFPTWVAEDETLLDQALSMSLTQVQKGYGYPVALAEAHNRAVVRGSDRTRFFALLEQQMIQAGLKNIGTSYKETRKRGSIA